MEMPAAALEEGKRAPFHLAGKNVRQLERLYPNSRQKGKPENDFYGQLIDDPTH